ncbi:septum formation initiator family protein [Mogibacterium neglectum]|uniref:FtsB family cell division protein n=1 Tax=Mogibacterium neglectum TaxID=114528 RepID=UPI002729B287|nr:septum formation initiator family protein [Mogibacterium neglectum]WLD76248.1 septum formation initiator family protein [Mogibacterium neglectum]
MSKSKKKNREMRSSERVTTVSAESRETRLETRKKQRKQRSSSRGIFSKPANRRNLIIAAVVLLLLAASVRNIVKLELENRRLKNKQKELIEQRKELKIELRNVNSKEYIEEQARKQLRLVNPDEILFVFPNEKDKDNAKDK